MSEALVKLQIDTLEEGGYVATSEQVPGLVAQGRTLAETIEIAQDVARKILESCIEHGDPIPEVFQGLMSSPTELTVPIGVP
ncbi:type II toxin-antitoxin system HicB family antitoxin [bacterium]|nr:type II toxin-antitoxin system HicB family antitoxin [bacterium]